MSLLMHQGKNVPIQAVYKLSLRHIRINKWGICSVQCENYVTAMPMTQWHCGFLRYRLILQITQKGPSQTLII